MKFNIHLLVISISSIVGQNVVPNQYIVAFNSPISNFANYVNQINQLLSNTIIGENKVLHQFEKSIQGITIKTDPAIVPLIKALPFVRFVQKNNIVKAFDKQVNAPWGLARISQRNLPLPILYTYNYNGDAGKGTNVYVLDTGINTNHTDFQGRASWGKTTVSGASNRDVHGHGTHCAGTIGGLKYGVAKQTSLIAVKVLGDNGEGDDSSVISGIEYVLEQVQKGTKGAIISMSLGGDASQALDDAVNNAVDQGVVVVVAAGNENQDASNVSPARAEKVITVGATDQLDNMAQFSNYGEKVDILAPGVKIESDSADSNDGTSTKSGTSMACPHVAGVVSTLLSQNVDAKDIKKKLIEISTKDRVSILTLKTDTPNRLAFNGYSSN